jgi:hypothetical protein
LQKIPGDCGCAPRADEQATGKHRRVLALVVKVVDPELRELFAGKPVNYSEPASRGTEYQQSCTAHYGTQHLFRSAKRPLRWPGGIEYFWRQTVEFKMGGSVRRKIRFASRRGPLPLRGNLHTATPTITGKTSICRAAGRAGMHFTGTDRAKPCVIAGIASALRIRAVHLSSTIAGVEYGLGCICIRSHGTTQASFASFTGIYRSHLIESGPIVGPFGTFPMFFQRARRDL